MTKQEEIRGGMKRIIHPHICLANNDELHAIDREIDELFSYLHSQGVVIKSKKQKVSVTFGGLLKDNKDIFRVEPLIKEGDDRG